MRALLAALALVAAPALAHAQTDSEVAIGPEPKALHGSIMRPAGPMRRVAVLMIAGSGPTDRNSNSSLPGVKPDTFRLIAEALATDGVESLRFDKRGIAASTAAGPSEADLRFTTYVDDAVAWAERLRQEPGVKCVVILGHSEGALIGTMAASRTPVCGFISISGIGRPADQVLVEQLSVTLPPTTMEQVKAIFAKLKAGQTVPDAPIPQLFRPSAQPYMISWLAVDPRVEIAKVRAPTLIMQGDNDIQVGVADAKLLAAAKPDARLVILPGVNHILKTAPRDRPGNLATYADPGLPLAPGVAETITSFVNAAGSRH